MESTLSPSRIVIAITGYQFSGKTTIGREISRLSGFHHLDDDAVRHALFPRNKLLAKENKKRAYSYIRDVMMNAADLNLRMGCGVVMSSTFGSDEAKRPFLSLRALYQENVPTYVFRLVLPEKIREEVVRMRAIERYGADEAVLARKLEGYEYMRQITTPWPKEVGVIELDASQSVHYICKAILGKIPKLEHIAP